QRLMAKKAGSIEPRFSRYSTKKSRQTTAKFSAVSPSSPSDKRLTPAAVARRAPLLRHPTAVDDDVGAGDEARFLGAQVDGQRADFLHAAPAADRNPLEEHAVLLGIFHQRLVHLGGERPGTDAVDRHVEGRQ